MAASLVKCIFGSAATGPPNATQAWNRAQPVEAGHPYLERKGPDGTKLFTAGRKQGTSFTMGEMEPGAPVVLVEGFATAATIRETTGLTTVAAFDAGNLLKVAQQLRAQDPTRPIIVAADNDHHLPRRDVPLANVGLEKATAAAAAVNGTVMLPDFGGAETQPLARGVSVPTDWNDFKAIYGAQAVRRRANTALERHGLELGASVGEKPVRLLTQAERDAARQAVEIAAERAVQRAAKRQGLGLGM